MKGLTAEKICDVCGGKLFYAEKGDPNAEVTNVVIDSRLIAAGGVFIASKGERVDGHDFIPQVFEKGAAAVVCSVLPKEAYGICILVDDPFKALRDIASFYRKSLSVKIAGITGSVGKTSTKEFTAAVLSENYKTCATKGNHNNEIGVPLTLLRIMDEDECAVVEMGINHFGEMSRLTAMVKPDIAVITGIGECHLENLGGDRSGVLKAKSEIFEGLSENGVAVLNGEDDKLSEIEEVKGRKPLRYGFGRNRGFYICAEDYKDNGLYGSSAKFCFDNGEFVDVEVPLPGKHMMLNALAAACVGRWLGMSAEKIKKGIEKVEPAGGRSNVIKKESFTLIDDCYNANPTSVKAALDLLSKTGGKKIAVLGDMFELGENEKALHGQVGRYAAERGVDLLICVGTLSDEMFKEARTAGLEALWYESTDAFIEKGLFMPEKGSTVLIKASHGMHFEKIVERLK